ncbi:MAG: GTP-binding protein [Candidatus Lokiarchaeota archaeon]|nr:GTP-binding protein [Candidatus Lokiarchaeota archaeon]
MTFILLRCGSRIDITYKIIISGDVGVGKTELLRKYVGYEFDQTVQKLMGVSLIVKRTMINNTRILLQIWDLAGGKQFEFLLPTYARGCVGAIFMYDLTNKDSLYKLSELVDLFTKTVSNMQYFPIILVVGSKYDLREEREVSMEDVLSITSENGIYDYLECSSKTGYNTDLVFHTLVSALLKDKKDSNLL